MQSERLRSEEYLEGDCGQKKWKKWKKKRRKKNKKNWKERGKNKRKENLEEDNNKTLPQQL
jgi:hypothetical protein